MNDSDAIRRLIALYGPLLDGGRLEEWGQLFHPDAVFAVWRERYEGREAIVKGIGGMQPEAHISHLALTPIIDFEGEDAARAWTDFSVCIQQGETTSVANAGRYHDRLRREDGRWRFAERVVVMPGDSPPDGVPLPPSF